MEKSKMEKILETLLDEMMSERGTQGVQIGKYKISVQERDEPLEEPHRTKYLAHDDLEGQYDMLRSEGVPPREAREIAKARVKDYEDFRDNM